MTGVSMYKGKVDLHIHLDGSIAPQLIEHFIRKYDLSISGDLRTRLCAGEDCKSLYEYLSCFDIPGEILQSEEALDECAYELACRLADQGLIYAEIRFAPSLHCRKGLTQQMAINSALKGIDRAVSEHPSIQIGLIICFLVGDDRHHKDTLKAAQRYYGHGVCGMDMAGGEGLVPLESYRELFNIVKASGIPFTIHAGERGSFQNVMTAVGFGARRIGHGIAAMDSSECIKMLKEASVTLECCYTSNIQTKAVSSFMSHPIRMLYDKGIKVTVNTDNTTVSDTDLEREHEKLRQVFGFSDAEFMEMDRFALEAAFAPDKLKERLIKML